MKTLYLLLGLLLPAGLFAQLQKRFTAVVEYSNFTTVNDSTFQGDLTNWSDPLNEGYLPSGIQVGFRCLDAAGRMYRVAAVNSTTFSSANVNLVELQNSDLAPVGAGAVFSATTNLGLIPPAVANALGVTPVLRSKMDVHNAQVLDGAISDPDGNGLFSASNEWNEISVKNISVDTLTIHENEIGEKKKYTDPNLNSGDELGSPLYIDGNILVAGIRLDDSLLSNSGAVAIYEKTNGNWTRTAKIKPSDLKTGSEFGYSVQVSNGTIVVGSPLSNNASSVTTGAVYVFDKVGDTWTQTAKLLAGDGAASDQFGISVGIEGDIIVVGAKFDDDFGTNSGSAYVFERIGGTWTQVAKLYPADPVGNDQFGNTVDIDGGKIVIGAYFKSGTFSREGAAYIFETVDDVWTQTAKLSPPDPEANGYFSFRLTLDGDNLVLGSHGDDDNGTDAGSAYVFSFSEATWNFITKLLPSDVVASDYFSYSYMQMYNDTIVIGAPLHDAKGSNAGAAYVYTRSADNTWTEIAKLTASDASVNSSFGSSAIVAPDGIFVGSPGVNAFYQYSRKSLFSVFGNEGVKILGHKWPKTDPQSGQVLGYSGAANNQLAWVTPSASPFYLRLSSPSSAQAVNPADSIRFQGDAGLEVGLGSPSGTTKTVQYTLNLGAVGSVDNAPEGDENIVAFDVSDNTEELIPINAVRDGDGIYSADKSITTPRRVTLTGATNAFQIVNGDLTNQTADTLRFFSGPNFFPSRFGMGVRISDTHNAAGNNAYAGVLEDSDGAGEGNGAEGLVAYRYSNGDLNYARAATWGLEVGKTGIGALLFNAASVVFTDGRAGVNRKGIQYAADYSTGYDDRSLVDKAYVDRLSGKRAVTTASTDGSGQLTIAHGITSYTPDWASATMWGSNSNRVNVISVDATNIVLEVRDVAGATVNSTSVTVSWEVGKVN